MDNTFSQSIALERQRLLAQQIAIHEAQQQLADKLQSVAGQLKALDLYEHAKTTNGARPPTTIRRRAPRSQAPVYGVRALSAEKRRNAILELLQQQQRPLMRAEIAAHFGIGLDDRLSLSAIDNALRLLEAANRITQAHDRGPWRVL